jgi:anti-sigma-K factor RskA
MQHDPALRSAVESWERELMPMATPLSMPMPSPALWNSVAARVAARSATPPASRGFARWMSRWLEPRSLGMLAAGLLLGVSLSVVLPPLASHDGEAIETQIPALYAGILSDTAGRPTMLVSSRRHGRIVEIKVLRPIAVEHDRVLQLWALPRQGAPLALGTVPATGKGRIELAATSEELLAQVAELAVSVAVQSATAPPVPPADGFMLRGPCAKFW